MDLSNTAFRESGDAHWYTRDGEPMHSVLAAKTGFPRPTTLRDARKLDLLPSVTSVLSYLANPALDSWKLRQVLMSALTLPRNPLETEEQYASRIVDDSRRQAKEAAAWGTKFHQIAQDINTKRASIVEEGMLPWADSYQEWVDINIVSVKAAEAVLVDTEVGFAGTCDFQGEHRDLGPIVMDYKRQDVKGGKPSFYSKWLYQLAAYRHASKVEATCVSMVVDCNSPVLHTKVWTEEEVERGWEVFRAMCKVWQAEKNFFL